MDLARAIETSENQARMDAYFAAAEGARPFYDGRVECAPAYEHRGQAQMPQTPQRRIFFKADHLAERDQ